MILQTLLSFFYFFKTRTILYFIFLFFGIPSLWSEVCLANMDRKKAEEIALEYNKKLLIVKEGIHQANEQKLQAVSKWLPALHYRGEFRDIQKKELFFDIFSSKEPFSHQGYSSMFEVSQPLFSTNLIYGLKSKQIASEASHYEKATTVNELLLAVRQNYYSVVVLEKALDIERENIDYLSYALEQEQKRLDAGGSTTYEVHQNKVAVANAISLYYLTLKELKNARNALILTLGVDPLLEPNMTIAEHNVPLESIPEISMKLQEIEKKYSYLKTETPSTTEFLCHIKHIENAKKLILFSEKEVLDYLDIALQKRPDLYRSKLEVGIAEQNVKSKQGHYLPKLDGYARYSYNDDYLGTKSFASQKYYWSGGLVLNWNLFDSLLREHEIKEAKSIRRSSRIAYDKTAQNVEVEIRNSLYGLEEAIMSYLSSTQGVYLAEQARSQAADKLIFGKIPPLEYRDSVNLLLQARNQQNKASFDLISAYYRFRFATGIDADL